ncbi:hypothetical protein Y1Q_0017875 [Alligator mississippiensis]|uniref:Uncharacterized protein n=1 Tax=Alligator mississippiensis TaxID=8496 RepID=A0A151PH82_ALLMI|nr:hypothetical protein Y1Q_0017875 [Alligator mississippiensis]
MRSCSSFEDPTRRCLPGLTPHSCGVCTVPGVKGLRSLAGLGRKQSSKPAQLRGSQRQSWQVGARFSRLPGIPHLIISCESLGKWPARPRVELQAVSGNVAHTQWSHSFTKKHLTCINASATTNVSPEKDSC